MDRFSDVSGVYSASPVCATGDHDCDSLENGFCPCCEKHHCSDHMTRCVGCEEVLCLACAEKEGWKHGIICAGCWDEPEPDCECRRVDVDLYDARGCPLHNQHSKWNRRRKAIEERTEAA